jgi:hypothetical protein
MGRVGFTWENTVQAQRKWFQWTDVEELSAPGLEGE